jgi:hypothetical protein
MLYILPVRIININSDMPVCFVKAKQEYTVRKMGKDKRIQSILISTGMKFSNRKKFRFGIPAYTGPFPALMEKVETIDV